MLHMEKNNLIVKNEKNYQYEDCEFWKDLCVDVYMIFICSSNVDFSIIKCYGIHEQYRKNLFSSRP